MNPRLPPGVRDYLPVAAARRRGLAATAAAELERWGYRGIITPLYEYADVLARGMGSTAQAMRFVDPASGEVVALRPDLTPQVARIVATRMHDEPGPVRLYYQGSVVRLDGARREIFQIGVELVDAPQPGGDLEVVALAEATLGALGIAEAVVDLGHAAIVQSALAGLGLDDAALAALHTALQRKDGAAVAALAARAHVSPSRRKLLAALPTLYGGPEVLERARALVEDAASLAAVDELALLCGRLAALGAPGRLSIDLGEVRGFDYYTGTRFALYADGAGGALASGGRYDGLVARYGRPARAVGFALDVDRTAELLKVRGVPAPRQSGGVLVAGEPVAAARTASELRAKGERVVLDLDEPAAPDADLQRRAAARELSRIAVAGPAGIRWLNGSS
jgi:ATP phosphoribosyltransferase regulatory subunit